MTVHRSRDLMGADENCHFCVVVSIPYAGVCGGCGLLNRSSPSGCMAVSQQVRLVCKGSIHVPAGPALLSHREERFLHVPGVGVVSDCFVRALV